MHAVEVVRGGSREYHVVGTVWGLASEAERVRDAFDAVRPHAVGLGVGPEDLEGIERLEQGAAYEHDYSESDEVYAHFLEQFGPVEIPPRDLVEAHRLAKEREIPVFPLDFPEVEYVEAFTEAISAWDLLRYNRRVRRVARRPPRADDALAFHLWWDRHIARLKGFAALERQREGRMAGALLAPGLPAGRVLVLVEAARVEGLTEQLRARLEADAQTRSLES